MDETLDGSTPAEESPVWPEHLADLPGQAIVRLSVAGTGLFVVGASAASIAPEQLGFASAVIDLVLFAVGTAAFLWAFAVAVGRSRTVVIGVGGLFFLQGCAPKVLQRVLMSALVVQVVIAFVTASIRVYTALAFGLLVPMFGLGLAGLWGAVYGWFPARPPE
jgi:hypothetical protein